MWNACLAGEPLTDSPERKTGAEPMTDGADIVRLEHRRLLTRHCTGDQTAFTELVQLFKARVYGYVRRAGVNPAAADDLFQEIFLKIHRAADQYRPELPLEPWLFTIVANTVRSHFRTHQQRMLREAPEEESSEEETEQRTKSPSAEEAASAGETVRWLERALGDLPFTQREVLLLVTVEHLPQNEVARMLGIPVNTVKTLLRRGREGLARAYAKRESVIQEEVLR